MHCVRATALGSFEYTEAMSHFSTVNAQQSACVVQPSTQEQVATILCDFLVFVYDKQQMHSAVFR